MKPSKNSGSLSSNISLTQVQYSGPLPPPEIIEKYEKISPGFAERILKMAEKDDN